MRKSNATSNAAVQIVRHVAAATAAATSAATAYHHTPTVQQTLASVHYLGRTDLCGWTLTILNGVYHHTLL